MEFYEIYHTERFANAWWNSIAMNLGGPEPSENCIYHNKSWKRPNPLTIDLKSKKIGDFIWTWYSECIITDKVANLFKEIGFTGFRLAPVIVSKFKGGDVSELPKLWEFVVTGKGGIAHEKSGIKLKEECEYCGDKVYTGFHNGLFVDENQWDKSDFFTIWPLPKFIIVTERVKNFIEENKLKNVKFIKTSNLIGKGDKGELGPGTYEDWINAV